MSIYMQRAFKTLSALPLSAKTGINVYFLQTIEIRNQPPTSVPTTWHLIREDAELQQPKIA